jgi:hypothetical protein
LDKTTIVAKTDMIDDIEDDGVVVIGDGMTGARTGGATATAELSQR